MLASFIRDESGAALLEYGLLAALIAVVAIAAVRLLGSQISAVFSRVATELSSSQGI